MILVTGAGGFVGRHLLIRLAEERRPLRAMVRDLNSAQIPHDAEVVEADLTRPGTLPAAVEGVEVVVHCAAVTADQREQRGGHYEEVNHRGTENLVEAARKADVRRLVLMSGLGTFEAPEGTYMATRWGMEDAVRSSGIPHVILQPSVLFGDGAPFVAALAGLVRRAPVVPLLGSEVRFQPLWIEDLTRCLLRAVEDGGLTGRSYPLGGSDQLTMRELMRTIAGRLGRRRWLLPVPVGPARLPAAVMAATLRRPPLTPATLELFGFDNVTDLDAVQRHFGFRPRGFREYVAEHGLGLA
ncbi:MAG: NAD(P)H-binding protein [Candidatus Dormibacteraeota bacterium]|nr:NAD(P)H-binding protein [Candidatus Dormibacteraeota bacterium]